jgi:hypothetical protein
MVTSVSVVLPVWIQEVLNFYTVDPEAQQLLQELALVSPSEQGYSLHEGLIRFKGRIWVGANSTTQTKIIKAFHSSSIGGLSRIQATHKKIRKLFSWKGLKSSVESFV